MTGDITAAQVRAARALLGWSIIDLSKTVRVSVSTIKRVEDERLKPATDSGLLCIRGALESAGVSFLPDEGDGLGLRCRAVRADG